jgi:hypothetical protein
MPSMGEQSPGDQEEMSLGERSYQVWLFLLLPILPILHIHAQCMAWAKGRGRERSFMYDYISK